MTKKGFSLIELLAVIVIIAIVVLIAVPIVSGLITNSKLKALKQSGIGLLRSANLYRAETFNAKTIRFDITNNKIESKDTNELLSYKGTVEKGTVLINKNGDVALCLIDGTSSVYKNYGDKELIESSNRKCLIPTNTCKVYLENDSEEDIERTEDDLCGQEVTNKIKTLEHTIDTLITAMNNKPSLEDIYPVGSIYMSMEEDTAAKVAAKLGGTWEKIENRFLLAQGSSYAINTTGGSSSTTLAVGNLPAHNHSIPALSGSTGSTGSGYSINYTYANRTTSDTGNHTHYMFEDTYKEWPIYSFSSSNTDWWYWWKDHAPRAWESKWTQYGNPATMGTTSSSGSHSHTYPDYYASSISGVQAHTHSVTTNASTTGNQGSGTSFTNMPPYITVYVYKKISNN